MTNNMTITKLALAFCIATMVISLAQCQYDNFEQRSAADDAIESSNNEEDAQSINWELLHSFLYKMRIPEREYHMMHTKKLGQHPWNVMDAKKSGSTRLLGKRTTSTRKRNNGVKKSDRKRPGWELAYGKRKRQFSF